MKLKRRIPAFPSIPVSRLALCEANCKKPVYTMHRWWARRLGVVFRMLLLGEGVRESPSRAQRWSRFYSPYTLPEGFRVLDPFLGGGTSLVEAAKLGADCIGVDIDPVACFVTEQELNGADPTLITAAFETIKTKVGAELASLYRTKVARKMADVVYFFWVDNIECPSCRMTHDGHPTFQLSYSDRDSRQTVICPECYAIKTIPIGFQSFTCGECSTRVQATDVPVKKGFFACPSCDYEGKLSALYAEGRVAPRLFAKEYLTQEGERGFSAVSASDIAVYDLAARKLRSQISSLPIPDTIIPSQGRVDRRPLLYGYRRYREMFNERQLYCLGLLAGEISQINDVSVKKSLALAFSHCLASNNMFCGYAFGYRRLTPLFSVHSFRKISRPVEGNVLGLPVGRGSFANCVRGVVEGCQYMRDPYEFRYDEMSRPKRVTVNRSAFEPSRVTEATIMNGSSAKLDLIANESIDLILSDPPYFDNLPYSELSDFYHVWLRRILRKDYVGHSVAHTPLAQTLFAGRRAGGTNDRADAIKTYTATLTKVFRECHRVAKPKARFVFTFHHRDRHAWAALGGALLASGFHVLRVFPVRSEGRSGLHSYSGTIKWDSVFVAQKQVTSASLTPGARGIVGAARWAWLESGQWLMRIRQAGMEFGWADRRSLAMSLLLMRFSRKQWAVKELSAALQLVEARSSKYELRESRSVSGSEIEE